MNNAAYYYIPLCNKEFTFENIFSSESISPIAFYEKRSFGIAHFYKIDGFHLDEAIVLYNVPPKFTVERTDGVKFLLAINQSQVEKDDIIFISEGIIALQKTIYLTKENFKLLFFSEKEMKFVLAKSELSLPTKSLRKYHNNIEVIDEISCVEVSTAALNNVSINGNNFREILLDRKFNTFKGFFYGLVTEIFFEKSNEEVKLRRSLQLLINAHAEFKNKQENKGRLSDSRFGKNTTPIAPYFSKVLERVKELEVLLFTFFPKTTLSNEEIAQLIFDKNPTLFHSIEDAVIYIHHKFIDSVLVNSTDYQVLKKLAVSNLKDSDPSALIEIINDNFKKNFSTTGTYHSSRLSSYYNDEAFKNAVFKLSFLIEEFFSSKRTNSKINLDEIIFDATNFEVRLGKNFGWPLSDAEESEYLSLANVVLKKSKAVRGEVKKVDILEIVKAGARAQSKAVESSDTLLYKYLNGQLDIYPLEKVSSTVMKNFVAFIFNPDSLEALEKFLQANEIQNKWMAYSFWCGFNGFANISSNFLKPIFAKDIDVQNAIDKYLENIGQILYKDISTFSTDTIVEDPNTTVVSRESDFFEKYIQGKFDLTLSDLLYIVDLKKEGDKLKMLKAKHSIDNKRGKQLLHSYKEFMKSPDLFA